MEGKEEMAQDYDHVCYHRVFYPQFEKTSPLVLMGFVLLIVIQVDVEEVDTRNIHDEDRLVETV